MTVLDMSLGGGVPVAAIAGYFEVYKREDYGITGDMSLEEARELVRKGPR